MICFLIKNIRFDQFYICITHNINNNLWFFLILINVSCSCKNITLHEYITEWKIIIFDINLCDYVLPHQEFNFAPNGWGLELRSILFCCCSNSRCSLSLRFCSLNVFVGSPNSFVVSSSQPTALSSQSPSSFYGSIVLEIIYFPLIKSSYSRNINVQLVLDHWLWQTLMRSRIHFLNPCPSLKSLSV